MPTDNFLPAKYNLTHRATTKYRVQTNVLRYFKKIRNYSLGHIYFMMMKELDIVMTRNIKAMLFN